MIRWIPCCCAFVAASLVAQPPLLHYPFSGPIGDGLTTNIGTFAPGPHPLVGHEEDCTAPSGVGTALRGGGGTTHQVTTGFNPSALGTGSWTVGFCITNQPNPSGTALQYVFGGTTLTWRIFSGGVAGSGNLLMRATGLPDTLITGGAGDTGWVHCVWVFDAALNRVRAYLNGAQVADNAVTGTYAGLGASTTAVTFAKYTGSTASLRLNNCMDDARLYGRAITPAEVASWSNSCLPCLYQVNSANAYLDADGLTNNQLQPIIAQRCAGTIVNITINGLAGAGWDLAYTFGTTAVPDTFGLAQAKININLGHPSFGLLNLGTFPPLVPLPNLPVPAPLGEIDAQVVVLDSSAPLGLRTSAAVCLVGVAASATPLPGPTGDDAALVVNTSAQPLCGTPVSHYGTVYSQINVITNGRITFGTADTTFTPTVAGALSGPPMIGTWMDLNPGAGGNITIDTATPNQLSVNYNNVVVFGTTLTVNVRIYYNWSDCSWCIVIQGNPAVTSSVFRGTSRGGPAATDPGAQIFGTGLSGLGTPNGMIYDFGTFGTLPAGTLMLTSAPGSPNGGNGYDWSFM